ncbi:AIPR family protein [Desulfotignum balticum]|uniref:AIPR family protein n=1 Tax=Desulfotignum balticum TaxID=115781 RepID=UPI0003F77828|nr:AIPR family protein [Desulfotignum balticum]
MDRITKALLNEFIEQNGLETLPEDQAFEHFSGFLVTSGHYSESFASDDIAVGAGGDCGIDCIAILVNGTIVSEPEEIEDLADTNGYLDVNFVFTQAERSGGFETAKIGQFVFGVCDFFSETPQLPQNDRVQLYARIAREIFDRSRLFKKGNPQCLLYYVTTGKWTDDANLVVRRDAGRQDVEELNLFRKVGFGCVDADQLQRLYRESQNAIATEIKFSERTVIPEIPGVEQAYLGLLPASQFLKLVENDNDEVLTSLFYDNVRHWQDWNPVNSEMRDTLSSPDTARYFPLLNNGVTIVARRVHPTGNKFLLEDYQVVNGCQTSYVLHECRVGLTDEVMIPVRLIATQDDNIKNSIIKATNRQTQVTEDQLFALSDFPKKLESYFPTFDGRKKLYYERRSRQYNGMTGVEKVRVISMTHLVRAFASIFRALPHRTTRNYKTLLRGIGTEIFNMDHRQEPYYTAAYAHYRLEFFFRSQVLPAELKPARYHLLLAYRILVIGEALPPMNSHNMARQCSILMDSLWDDDTSRKIFQRGADHVRVVAAGNLHRDNIRTEPFTEALLQNLRSA